MIGPGAREDVENEAFSLTLAKAHAAGRQLTAAELEQLKEQTTTSTLPVKPKGKKRKKDQKP